MQPGARILLVDDDVKLSRLLAEYLRTHGHSASIAKDGAEGLALATEHAWDLIVLDVMMPKLDGIEVLQRLRAASRVPILMLTARGKEDDRILGLETGADDYVPKTISSRELLARINALLRRAAQPVGPQPAEAGLVAGEVTIRRASRSATLRGAPLELTAVEFELLAELVRHSGEIRSRAQLLECVRDREFSAFDRSIDVHVAALRRKLGDDPKNPRFIRTVRSAGYLFLAPTSAT